MALQFTRNAKIYIELGSDVWQIPVLDGFSFTQAINASEITINEAGDDSRRARLLFNDNLAPVDWSFSTYARPFKTGGSGANGEWDGTANDIHAVEEVLWAMFVGADTYTSGTTLWTRNGGPNAGVANAIVNDTSNTFNLDQSNISKLSDNFDIYFSFEETAGAPDQVYKVTEAVVNSATIDFDIDGIATIQWSGFGKQVIDNTTTIPTITITEGITDTGNFIRNRISTLDLTRTDAAIGNPPNAGDTSPGDSSPADLYNIVLTGGSITFENNINYLVPEELGLVNIPLANITGARAISGNVTCYLDNDQANSKSGELFADLVSDTSTVRNVFDMTINIGGSSSGPRLAFALPTAHLEVPVINVEDLLTLDVTFHGQVADGNVDSTNEATIIYKA